MTDGDGSDVTTEAFFTEGLRLLAPHAFELVLESLSAPRPGVHWRGGPDAPRTRRPQAS